MFHFEAKQIARPLSPVVIQPITTPVNQINLGKIIGIAVVVGIAGFIPYKIWQHYYSKEPDK